MNSTILYPANAEKAATLRANLSAFGVKARVRVMPNGAARIVLANATDRDSARDAFVLSNACTCCGESFASQAAKHAWNGPTEIFIRFLEA